MIEKIKNMRITFDYGKLALFFSLMAMAFVGMSQNTPCAYAQAGACSVGENIIATGNIGIMGGTSDTATFDASGITAARTLTIPDASGTIALSSGALPINKVMATDGAGAETTTDVYPLSLSVSKSINTDVSGNLETNDVYPLTLTADTPLKTNVCGQSTASDLDITTDITPGAALEQIRVNAAANALEYFVPSASGGRWTLVGQGTAVNDNAYGTGTMIACWYDNTQGTGIGGSVDQTKNYKLVLVPTNDTWISPTLPTTAAPELQFKVDQSCVTGSLSGYGGANTASGAGMSYAGWKVNGETYFYNLQNIYYQQGATANTTSACGMSSLTAEFRNGKYITVANTDNDGIIYKIDSNAQCWQSGVASSSQSQTTRGKTIMDSGDTSGDNLDDVTGMWFRYYGDPLYPPMWFLYESNE